ncbi:MAG: hypothetical protein GYA24_08655 [Candidatus Lokiarchaeota archaeon]|nr:hypothetical protein [Candidatus Lokiarchaeota archaeon]
MLQYTVDGIILSILLAAAFTIGMIFYGAFAIGMFQRLRDGKSKVYSPLLEMFKHASKETSTGVTTSPQARAIVLTAWVVSSFAAFIFVPWGSLLLLSGTPVASALGNFQLFAVFGLLMVYPAGLMALCFVSKRKTSILNLKYLSEDFFSAFITFLVSMFSLLLLVNNGFSFSTFPTIGTMIDLQGQPTIAGIAFASFFGLMNPLAMVAYFATIPLVLDPISFSEDPLSRKWTPLVDFTGKELSLIKMIRAIRLVTLVAFLLDVFLGGTRFTSSWYIDMPTFLFAMLCIIALMSRFKLHKATWLLDRKISGFIRVHTVLAIAGLVLSIVLVYM